MSSPLTRRLVVLLAGVLLAGALAAAAAVGQPASSRTSHVRMLASDASTPLRASRLARAAVTFRGGPITTTSGEVVDVRVSDSLPLETSTPEGWAEFLAGLTHGPEIARLRTYIVTFSEVQEICGSRALGCYGRNEMVAPGEVVADISPEEVVRHEYGHHLANHSVNTPWAAIDWGPKRWASAANVCASVSRREAFPGDEGSNYARNPGEAWAEVYRLMDERKAGITTATWPIIASSFFPTEAALQAAEQDVVRPWTASSTRVVTKVFGKRTARVWWIPVAAPLDGEARISATMPGKGTHEVALVAADRRTVLKRAQWVGQRVKRLDTSICGGRSLFVRVTQAGALGRVRVSVTTP
ncbi:MAG TPA: hypothetical protein VFN06_02645 [Gaiellaceae bacterium]|nr:hypothetical protein [Gaiellaceae bacterium]